MRRPRKVEKDAECKGGGFIAPMMCVMPSRFTSLAIGCFVLCSVGIWLGASNLLKKKDPDVDMSNPKHLLELYQTTLVLTKLFDEFGVHYWAHDGMLLGAFRCQGVLPHDDDTDIGITRSDLEGKVNTAAFRAAANDLGYELSKRLGHYFGTVKFYKISSVLPGLRWGLFGHINVDVFPFDDQNLAPCEDLWLHAPANGMKRLRAAPGTPAYTRSADRPWNDDMEWHRYKAWGGWPSTLEDEAERQQEKWTSLKTFEPGEMCLPQMFGWPRKGRCIIRAKHVLPYGGKVGDAGAPDSEMYPHFKQWPFGAFTVRGLEDSAAEGYLKMCYGPDVTTHKHVWDHHSDADAEVAVELQASDREPRRPFVPVMVPVLNEEAAKMNGALYRHD